MADANDLFFFGDDIDAILDILEEEEDLDEQFREAVDEVSIIILNIANRRAKTFEF